MSIGYTKWMNSVGLLLFGAVSAMAQSGFQITTQFLPDGIAGQQYSASVATSGCPGPVDFSMQGLPDGVGYNQSSGSISGNPGQAGSFTVIVYAYCSIRESSAQAAFHINITDFLRISTTSLPEGATGVPYNEQVNAAGGKTPYVITVSGLPPGLTMTTSGNITGTPTTGGAYTPVFTVTDFTQANSSRNINLLIRTSLSITTPSPMPPGTVGVFYSNFMSGTGGLQPYVFRIANNSTAPPGLSLSAQGGLNGTPTTPGTFTFIAQLADSAGAVVTKTFTIVISNPGGPLTVAPTSLKFTTKAGADNPAPQNLNLTSTPSVAFSVQVDNGSGGAAPSWIGVTPRSGNTPGSLHVTAASSGMQAGTYSARIRATGAAGSTPVDVPVTLEIQPAAPDLTVAPRVLSFRARFGTPSSQEGTLVIRNSGGGSGIPVQISIVGGASWLRLDTTSGNVLPNAPVLAKVTVTSSGLAVRTYRDAIRVTSNLKSFDIPVTLTVLPSGPVMSLSQTGFRFVARQGVVPPETANVTVSNIGDPATPVIWKARVLRGTDLVSISPSQGSSGDATNTLRIALTGAAVATAGGKTAIVEVTQQGAEGTPKYVIVVADVSPTTAIPSLTPSPSGLLFIGDQGGTPPAAQTESVRTNSPTAQPFTVAAITDDGRNWLSAAATTASASSSVAGVVNVSVNQAGLAAGFYTGQVNLNLGTLVRSVNVAFLVRPPASPDAISQNAAPLSRIREAGCTPTTANVVQQGSVNNFGFVAGWPANLSVSVIDDCGTFLPNASVVASFSNNDPPLALVSDGVSRFNGTWQPGAAGTQITVRVDATAPALAAGQASITGTVDPPLVVTPVLSIGGLVNNFNRQGAAPLAPGSIMEVYGENLASNISSAPAPPLPTTFSGTEVIIGGLSAPIVYVSGQQLVIQVPYELSPNQTYSVLAISNNQPSLPQDISLIPASPGTAAFDDTRLKAQVNGVLVDTTRPARPNDILTIYLIGMGVTNPPVASGAPAPASPLARVPGSVTVTVDKQNAEIFYAGMTPGFSGLYQINFRVPPGVRPGNLDVEVTQDGVKANSTLLVVGQ